MTKKITCDFSRAVRQGDVYLIPFEFDGDIKITNDIQREGGSVVLAHGEVTGHKHQITEKNVSLHNVHITKDMLKNKKNYEFLNVASNDNVMLKVIEPVAFLKHEEHEKIPLPAGNYFVVRQVEYTPKGVRYVAD